MKSRSNVTSVLVTGALAGLVGTAAMMSIRAFDAKYAPNTIPQTKEDPGAFLLKRTEHAIGLDGKIPESLNRSAARLMRVGYGATAGVIYALIRRRRNASELFEGGLIGTGLYAAGYLGWLPSLRLTRPPWKQPFPAIAGEILRHVAYGVTTVATYEAMSWSRIGAESGGKATAHGHLAVPKRDDGGQSRS